MSATNISDVLTRIATIEQQLQQLQNGSLLDSALGLSGSASGNGSGSGTSTGASSPAFADALAQAEGVSSPSATGLSALTGGVSASSLASAGATGTGALPSGAYSQLTTDQQQFASTLSAETGLSPSVVSAWVLAEESGGAAQSRQAQGNNDWLNIGYTDSATYGSSDSIWSNPVTAAQATAQWLQGQSSIPGYGTASSGVQSILQSVGQTPAAQIQAIQGSGWASGGYPSLGSLYTQVSGTPVTA